MSEQTHMDAGVKDLGKSKLLGWLETKHNIYFRLLIDLISYDLSGNYKDRIGIDNTSVIICSKVIMHWAWQNYKINSIILQSDISLFCIDKDPNYTRYNRFAGRFTHGWLQSVSWAFRDYASLWWWFDNGFIYKWWEVHTASFNSPSLWRFGDDIRLKAFNDTIYTLSDKWNWTLLFNFWTGRLALWHQDRLEEDGWKEIYVWLYFGTRNTLFSFSY